MDGEEVIQGAGGDATSAATETGAESSSAERAMDFWEKGEPTNAQPGAAERAEQGTEAAASADAAGKAAGEQAEGAEAAAQQAAVGQLPNVTDEQLHADPRYKEVAQFREEVQPLLDRHGIPDTKELGLQLGDAQILYDIANGKGTPSQLLDVMIQNTGWSKDQVGAVAKDLIGWLTKGGFLKDGAAAGGEAQARGSDGKFKDPVEERMDRLERERREEQERTQRASEQRTTQERQSKIFNSFTTEVGKLCEGAKIDKADLEFYVREIRALLPAAGTREFEAVTGRIEKGNFVDVKKGFDTIHKREVERLKRYSTSAVKNAERRTNANPRSPAGGSPPAPAAGKPQRDLRTSEGRVAAATAEWNK